MRVALEARDAQLRHSLQRVADADQLAASLRAAVAVRDSELWAKVHPSCIMHRASFLQASYMPHASVHAACIMHPSCIVHRTPCITHRASSCIVHHAWR